MGKTERSLQEKVHDWLYESPGNIVWQDSYFYDNLIKQYGRDTVEKERKRQENGAD